MNSKFTLLPLLAIISINLLYALQQAPFESNVEENLPESAPEDLDAALALLYFKEHPNIQKPETSAQNKNYADLFKKEAGQDALSRQQKINTINRLDIRQVGQEVNLPAETVEQAFKYFTRFIQGFGKEPLTRETIIDFAEKYRIVSERRNADSRQARIAHKNELKEDPQALADKFGLDRIVIEQANKYRNAVPSSRKPQTKAQFQDYAQRYKELRQRSAGKARESDNKSLEEKARAYARWVGLGKPDMSEEVINEFAQKYDLHVKKAPGLADSNRQELNTFNLDDVARNLDLDPTTVKKAFDYVRAQGLKAPVTRQSIEYYSKRKM